MPSKPQLLSAQSKLVDAPNFTGYIRALAFSVTTLTAACAPSSNDSSANGSTSTAGSLTLQPETFSEGYDNTTEANPPTGETADLSSVGNEAATNEDDSTTQATETEGDSEALTTTDLTTTTSESSTGENMEAICGNDILEAGEVCDDGNLDNKDACTAECQLATCGDGHTEEGVEECDDGNQIHTDACNNDCVAAVCGDGIINNTEACDDGGKNGEYNQCASDCKTDGPKCGDHVRQPEFGEECDDQDGIPANLKQYLDCSSNCRKGVKDAFQLYCDEGCWGGCNLNAAKILCSLKTGIPNFPGEVIDFVPANISPTVAAPAIGCDNPPPQNGINLGTIAGIENVHIVPGDASQTYSGNSVMELNCQGI